MSCSKQVLAAVAFASILCGNARAQMHAEGPPEKVGMAGLPLTAFDAYSLVRQNWPRVLFLDIRTAVEAELLGTPRLSDANVPFLLRTHPPAWDETNGGLVLERNTSFVALVGQRLNEKRLTRSDAVVLICADGRRGAQAADALAAAGYQKIYSVVDGFEGDQVEADTPSGRRAINGWKLSGLPWSYRKERTYFGLPSGEAVP